LGVLMGVCGVSGSGKSTLIVDTLARALAPQKQTTSVAREPVEPGAHDCIDGAPRRTVVVDQARAGVHSPAAFLGLDPKLRQLYSESAGARALGLGEEAFGHRCSACNGRGFVTLDMSFLPAVHVPCEVCRGSGCLPEAWEVQLRGLSLPELLQRTLDEALSLWQDEPALARPLQAAGAVGLGYLVLRQPAHALSGGEVQRLKIAAELCRTAAVPEAGPAAGRPSRRSATGTLYILDEPTVGQHLEDVARLIGVLQRLVSAGHSVIVIEHHPHLLAACDWLLELGPGGGPAGGRVIASGPPEIWLQADTPTAPYLREVLEGRA
jgi:excinuclease ABC subunit A